MVGDFYSNGCKVMRAAVDCERRQLAREENLTTEFFRLDDKRYAGAATAVETVITSFTWQRKRGIAVTVAVA